MGRPFFESMDCCACIIEWVWFVLSAQAQCCPEPSCASIICSDAFKQGCIHMTEPLRLFARDSSSQSAFAVQYHGYRT